MLRAFIRDIAERPLVLVSFDDKLWVAVVDRVIVGKDERVRFSFKDGSVVEGKAYGL